MCVLGGSMCDCVSACVCVFTQTFIIENFLLQGHGSVPKIQPSVLLHVLQTMAKAIEMLAFRLFGFVTSYGGQHGQIQEIPCRSGCI